MEQAQLSVYSHSDDVVGVTAFLLWPTTARRRAQGIFRGDARTRISFSQSVIGTARANKSVATNIQRHYANIVFSIADRSDDMVDRAALTLRYFVLVVDHDRRADNSVVQKFFIVIK